MTNNLPKIFYVTGSHGTVTVDSVSGAVLRYQPEPNDTEKGYEDITRFDLEEWSKAYPTEKIENLYIDILDLGFWCSNGHYEEPAHTWRDEYRKQGGAA